MLWIEVKKLVRDKMVMVLLVLGLLLCAMLSYLSATPKNVISQSRYDQALSGVLQQAQENLSNLNNQMKNSYAMEYQEQIINIYNKATAVDIDEEAKNPPSDLMDNIPVCFILAFLTLIFTAKIFLVEYEGDGCAIVMITPKGRRYLPILKILLLFICVILLTGATSLAVLLGNAIKCGMPNFGISVQTVPGYTFCPYLITAGTAFLLQNVIRALLFFVFGLWIAFLGSLLRSYLFLYLAGAALYGSGFLMHSLPLIGTNNYFLLCNCFDLTSVSALLRRYHGLAFGTHSLPYLWAILLFSAFQIFVLIPCVHFAVLRHQNEAKQSLDDRCKELLCRLFPKRRHTKRRRVPKRSLWRWEIYKLLVKQGGIILLILLLGVQSYLYFRQENTARRLHDSIYRAYITDIEGEYCDEKLNELNQRGVEVDDENQEIRNSILSGQVSLETGEEIDRFYALRTEVYAIRRAQRHGLYLQEKEKAGQETWFCYDTGYLALFDDGLNWTLPLFLLLLFCGIFSREKETGFDRLLICSVHGRGETARRKCRIAMVLSGICSLLFGITQLSVVLARYHMPAWNAPAVSIEIFTDLSLPIPLWAMYGILLLTRLFFAICVGLIISFLSCVCKKTGLAFLSGAAILYLPHFLAPYVSIFKYLDFAGMIAGMPEILHSIEQPGFDFTVLFLTMGMLAGVLLLWYFVLFGRIDTTKAKG